MSTIIGPRVKRKRNAESKMKSRREQGVRPREEYLSEAERKRQEIRKAIEDNPGLSIRALAKQTGHPKSAIQRVKASISE